MKLKILITTLIFLASSVNAATCSVSNDQLSFGTYIPLSGADNTSTFTVQISCDTLTSDTAYSISLTSGNSGDINNRKLLNGANELSYNIYTEGTYSNVWGDGSVGNTISGVATAPTDTKTHTGYGKLPQSQPINPGNYSDNITITVTY